MFAFCRLGKQLNHRKERIMENLRTSWKVITLFAFGAIVCLYYAGHPRVSAHPPRTLPDESDFETVDVCPL